MSDKLPYEQHLSGSWDDLPLPDENLAWADMKRRLEEEDNDRVLPFWLNGCFMWGLLAVLLAGGGWWLYHYYHKSEKPATEQTVTVSNKKEQAKINADAIQLSDTITRTKTTGHQKEQGVEKIISTKTNENADLSINNARVDEKRNIATYPVNKNITTAASNKARLDTKGNAKTKQVSKETAEKITDRSLNKTSITTDTAISKQANNERSVKRDVSDKDSSANKYAIINKDSVSTPSDSVKKKTAVKTAAIKKEAQEEKSKTKGSFSFSAGIAGQQQIPLAGQNFVPYGASGRKGTLADYIPSVYARLNRDTKWFLQAEFRYAAPQYTKQFVYVDKTITDSATMIRTTSTESVKKTFYHQLPLTFNYYVLPNWSVGAGIVWTKFAGAVTQLDVTKRNPGSSTDSFVVKGQINNLKRADSNFVNSFFQLAMETQYQYKRFSLGARYTRGLQPYIRFNLPGGPSEERNKSLQVFLRYELWNSKKKN